MMLSSQAFFGHSDLYESLFYLYDLFIHYSGPTLPDLHGYRKTQLSIKLMHIPHLLAGRPVPAWLGEYPHGCAALFPHVNRLRPSSSLYRAARLRGEDLQSPNHI